MAIPMLLPYNDLAAITRGWRAMSAAERDWCESQAREFHNTHRAYRGDIRRLDNGRLAETVIDAWDSRAVSDVIAARVRID